MALQGSNLESLLKKAKEKEKKYEWLESADFYEEASSLVQEDYEKASELRERIGYCFLRAAFQAETNEQFRRILKQSADAYEKTISLFQKSITEDKEAKICHAKAMIAYVNARLTPDITKRRKILAELWKFENDALKLYKKTANQLAIGKTYNNLSEWLFEKQNLESRWSEIKRSMIELIDYGEKAITALSDAGDEYELARAYCSISRDYGLAMYFRVFDISDQTNKKNLKYQKMALELSEKTGDAYLISRANQEATNFSSASGLFEHATKFGKNAVKYGAISKDNNLMGSGSIWTSQCIYQSTLLEVDPDKQREECKTALKFAQDGIHYLSIIDDFSERFPAYFGYVDAVKFLASIETNLETKRRLLEEAVKIGRENIKDVEGETIHSSTILFHSFSNALHGLSEIETRVDKKQRLLEEALYYREKQLEAMRHIAPFDYAVYSLSYKLQASILAELAKIESGQKKIKLLEKAVSAMDKCVESIEKDLKDSPKRINLPRYGLSYYFFGGILEQLNSLTKDKKLLDRAIETYKIAIKHFSNLNLKSRVAESYWQIAKLKNHLGENLESAQSYQTAAQTYKLAAEKHPKLKEFYNNHSDYMQAWSEIEQAKHKHSREEYRQSKIHYENAGRLHEQTDDWSYLSSNYFAWSKLEQAEELSRTEKPQEAINEFQETIELFKKTETNIKTKINTNPAIEEKDSITKILKASDLRCQYCQARILMEEAKLLEREGNYLDSSRNYAKASQKLVTIVSKVDVETERKELKYIAILCQAWEKMANAEEITSSESYLEAAALFEQAKDHCYTQKASLWALGNSNFCRGLAAGVGYQVSLAVEDHNKAKSYIKNAATNYLKAGYKNASEYVKATQRLFDAYAFMNQAENELDQEKRAKQYQMAENLLQIAAGSFMKAKQPEKTAQVQEILANVREEKALAVFLSQVMQAPSIASTTSSFTAPTSTNETSVGLERFQHADVQANLVSNVKELKVGESFCLSVEFVNAGREPALLMRVENFVPTDFVVVKKPEIYRIEDTTLNMKGKQLASLKLVEVKLTLQPSKKGNYRLNPMVYYLDELGQNKSLQLKTVEIKVEEVLLEGRVSTGTQELDSLLLGGIPNEYAVVLSGPPCDERELIVNNFLKAGTEEGITFYITTETTGLEDLLQKPNFYLFLCNPKPKTRVPDLPNVYKLQGKTDLNNLGIALVKAYRSIDQSVINKRICVEILSDVLEDYGSKTTRKWISYLITNYGAKGFTMLSVMNPAMHPPDQATAVIDLFDGEINIIQSDDPLDCKKSILVKKLRNQDYIKNPICLR
jgi:tetratricopeptide (TPR) repeat protein/KaiC/GvpD/RAD55 family RecA-like ATPase